MLLSAQVRVKRWGKSPPRLWRHRRQGKRRPEQDQIGGRPRAPVLTGLPEKGWPGRGPRVGRKRIVATRSLEK